MITKQIVRQARISYFLIAKSRNFPI